MQFMQAFLLGAMAAWTPSLILLALLLYHAPVAERPDWD
jgi:hypothetical protein